MPYRYPPCTAECIDAMRGVICTLLLLWGSFTGYTQTTVAKQSFETSGDTWTPLSFSTPPCTSGNDIWDYSTGFSNLTPNDGAQFWGIRDLDGSCGGSDFESITFPNVNISANSSVVFAFDYYGQGMDNNDDLKYELFYDNVSQGEVVVLDGVNGGSDNTNGWVTEAVNIPASVTNVSVILSARNNQNNDRAGFDNVRLFESNTGNDSCSNATALTVGTDSSQNVVTGDNTTATSSGELPNPTCGNYVARDLWFTAQVPSSGILTIETNSSAIDTAIEVYSGVCGSLTQISCNDDISYPSNLNSRVEITNLPNTTVYVRVWSYNNETSGSFTIVAYSTPTPDNNDCLDATTLIVGSTNTENIVTATNEGATGTDPAPNPNCDGYAGGDVWFTATIPASGILNIETTSAGGITDTGVAVYTGSCGSLTQIDCDADSGPGFFSVINLTGLPNTTVYIRVWEYQNNNFGAFNIVAYSPSCPFSTTWNGSSWNNGAPNDFTSVLIDGDYSTGSNGDFDSCDCSISAGNSLIIDANTYVLVENDLNVDGNLEVAHEGSLVMIDNGGSVTVNGSINVHKTSTPFNQYDYMYWSSPTANETIGSALVSSVSNRIYSYDHLNTWQFANGSTVMEAGRGYIAMGDTSGSFPKTQSVIFDGPLNTGTILRPVGYDASFGYGWNLVGNPYPSAVDASLLLNNTANTGVVNGTIYLWTHNTERSESTPGTGKYNYSSNDYASYTVGTGGVAAVSGGPVPNGNIASGQGFFIQATTSGDLTFDNSMRVTTNNDQLFRGSEKTTQQPKDRIWLDMKNNEGAFSQILIGFIEGATNGIDRNFDGPRFWGNSYVSFYSINDESFLAINGKRPLADKETIKLGYYTTINQGDSLKIAIQNLEGQLHEYQVYLNDKQTGALHDLRQGDYEFAVEEQGLFNDRFELQLIKASVLSVEEEHEVDDDLLIVNRDEFLEFKTTNRKLITSLRIFDILGKPILKTTPHLDHYNFDVSNLKKGTIILISATFENNQKISKKFLIN